MAVAAVTAVGGAQLGEQALVTAHGVSIVQGEVNHGVDVPQVVPVAAGIGEVPRDRLHLRHRERPRAGAVHVPGHAEDGVTLPPQGGGDAAAGIASGAGDENLHRGAPDVCRTGSSQGPLSSEKAASLFTCASKLWRIACAVKRMGHEPCDRNETVECRRGGVLARPGTGGARPASLAGGGPVEGDRALHDRVRRPPHPRGGAWTAPAHGRVGGCHCLVGQPHHPGRGRFELACAGAQGAARRRRTRRRRGAHPRGPEPPAKRRSPASGQCTKAGVGPCAPRAPHRPGTRASAGGGPRGGGSPRALISGGYRERCISSPESMGQLGDRRGERPDLQPPAVLIEDLGENPGVLVHLADAPLAGVGNHQLCLGHGALEELQHALAERGDILRRVRREDDRLGVPLKQGFACFGGEPVRLVEQQLARDALRPDVPEHLAGHLELGFPGGIGGIHHVEQQGGLQRLIQRRAEGGHEIMRQFLDEAHGV
ncbi:hypothetical protein STIAU_0095 [Stigmatella aurantiaca DW4/3-1]|uniref:Uncharacterized protein n=1 Tax=Stigmatella aurantiaca (strain DW4/3-1) TaxID=378806 RepID=Q093K6_STIAD|nr:hypothetical protein STIAU_0095 [Stigmatella aurantiaca DW4/3-1]